MGGAEEPRWFPFTSSSSSPNFFQRTAFLFISGLRTPLSVKYIVGLTISRGFNGAIKPSSLPTTNKLRSTVLWNLEQVRAGVVMVEFGARVEGGELVSLWPDASCPQDLEALLFHQHNTKSFKIQKCLRIPNESEMLCCGMSVVVMLRRQLPPNKTWEYSCSVPK